jgi:hypothetical protein
MEILGCKLEPDQAGQSSNLDEFFAVSDFILDNDPAVRRIFRAEKSISREESANIENVSSFC